MLPTWNGPVKLQARQDTIIDIYRKVYGRQSIPNSRQYWAMAGSYEDDYGRPIFGECHQMVDAKLIKQEQFFGVDIDKKTIERNMLHYPNLNWLQGEFFEAMDDCSDFNPAIVNYDDIRMKDKHIFGLADLLSFLEEHSKGDLMVVSNFILNNPRNNSKSDQLQDGYTLLCQIYDLASNWKTLTGYEYTRNDDGRHTVMGTIVLKRK